MRTKSRLPVVLFLLVQLLGLAAPAQQWKKDLLTYVSSLEKSSGGWGWEDQPDAHITPSYAAVGILYHLDALPLNRTQYIAFMRTHHPQRGGSKETGPSGSQLRNLTYQQIQAILWLGGDVSEFKKEVEGWKSQAGNISNYETHGYPALTQEVMSPVCRSLLNLSPNNNADSFLSYLTANRRANGSFNNAPASLGGDGNIINSFWSITALLALQQPPTSIQKTISWINSCQRLNGGFTHQPAPSIGVNDDVAYTWAAIRSLVALKSTPARKEACIKYLCSLRNSDGGFGNRPGLPSTAMATYYAVESLKLLDGLPFLNPQKVAPHPKMAALNFEGYKTFSVQFEASGSGSPQEAVAIARRLRIQLWGAKNAAPGWITAAQSVADKNGVPVRFFNSSEPYNKNVIIPGMGSFGHILDYIAPAGTVIPFGDSTDFETLRKESLRPLQRANGGLLLQVSNNEPLARLLLDESLAAGAYLGISTIHFGQNFLFFLPYLQEYRHRLPFITLQDAHGTEAWWWSGELTNHRTLFIAREPTYEALIHALKNNWVAAVRHDSISDYKTRMLGGTPEARAFFNRDSLNWAWWGRDSSVISPEWAAISLVNSTDSFEADRPSQGHRLRIRCLWSSVRETLKEPIVVLEALSVNNTACTARPVVITNKRGTITDAYYLCDLPPEPSGKYAISALLKNRYSGRTKNIETTISSK